MSDTAMPFQLTILGTSSALPTSNRYPTAQVLHVSGRFFLIDCGEGTQTQMRKYKIGFSKINHIFHFPPSWRSYLWPDRAHFNLRSDRTHKRAAHLFVFRAPKIP